MQPIAEPPVSKRTLIDRLAVGILIGVVAVSIGTVALITVYMNRIEMAAERLRRVEPLASYQGRPAAVGVDGVAAVNYLVMTTGEDGRLESALIAHLSASRRNLTLIALPTNLLADDGSGRMTLSASYLLDPLRTARAVESLTGVRMDHQVHIDLGGFRMVVDRLGGIEVAGTRLTGTAVIDHLDGASDPRERSVRTAELLQGALARSSLGTSITEPDRFDKVLDALTPCIVVDSGLTADEIQSTLVESRVHADEIATWPLATTAAVSFGVEADPADLADLREALVTDNLPNGGAESVKVSPMPEPTR